MRIGIDMTIPQNPALRVRWRTSDELREFYVWFSPWYRPRWRLVRLARPVIPWPALLTEATRAGVTIHPAEPCRHTKVRVLETGAWECSDCHARVHVDGVATDLDELVALDPLDEWAQPDAEELARCIRCRMQHPFGHLEYNAGVCARCIARANG